MTQTWWRLLPLRDQKEVYWECRRCGTIVDEASISVRCVDLHKSLGARWLDSESFGPIDAESGDIKL
jgi:hypothetical protein